MLRICLIIAIVAGAAATTISFVKVKEVITTTIAERDDFHGKLDTETAAHTKTKAKLKTTESELAGTKTKLTQTRSDLEAANTKVSELDKRSTELTSALEKTKTERDDAQQKLAQWDQVPLKPAEALALMGKLKKAQEARVAVEGENKIMVTKVKELNHQLAEFIGTSGPVPLPPGLKGTVLAVDPKFDFVVLDIGEDKGALERGEMLVNRHGHLIGKVRIASVEKNRCIANIMPGWGSADVMEGDQVLY